MYKLEAKTDNFTPQVQCLLYSNLGISSQMNDYFKLVTSYSKIRQDLGGNLILASSYFWFNNKRNRKIPKSLYTTIFVYKKLIIKINIIW